MEKVTELQLMLASSRMPRGVGETKLRAVLTMEADPRRWTGMAATTPPAGWTPASFAAFLAEWPVYDAWRAAELPFLPYPAVGPAAAAAETVAPAKPNPNAQTICCTGFRDKDMEARAMAAGHTIAAGVTGKTTVLVVPEGPLPNSEKVKAAQAKGITILSRDKFIATYLK
jgi:NAD-dependent DNA ligase